MIDSMVEVVEAKVALRSRRCCLGRRHHRRPGGRGSDPSHPSCYSRSTVSTSSGVRQGCVVSLLGTRGSARLLGGRGGLLLGVLGVIGTGRSLLDSSLALAGSRGLLANRLLARRLVSRGVGSGSGFLAILGGGLLLALELLDVLPVMTCQYLPRIEN